MSRTRFSRPLAGEHATYYEKYVAAVPEGDLLGILRDQRNEMLAMIATLDDTRSRHRYAEGKWSVKQVLGHIIDAEQVFAYRALRIARGDRTPLPGFDQNLFADGGGFDDLPLDTLSERYQATRSATLALLSSLGVDAEERTGEASGAPVSVRALAYIIAGHERHHLNILRERYFGGAASSP